MTFSIDRLWLKFESSSDGGQTIQASSRISERKLRDRLEEGKKSDPYVVHYKMALFLVVENFIMLVCLPSCVIALMVLFDGTIKTK